MAAAGLASMVRAVGIEPTLLAEPDFESGASTSSTTPAPGPVSRADRAPQPGFSRRGAAGADRRLIDGRAAPIAQRLADMAAADTVHTGEIGDRARDPQHAVIAPRGQPHLLGCLREQRAARRVGGRDAVEQIAIGL